MLCSSRDSIRLRFMGVGSGKSVAMLGGRLHSFARGNRRYLRTDVEAQSLDVRQAVGRVENKWCCCCWSS
jgi:hypothetical protein